MDISYLSDERLQERLWSRVDVQADPDTCWEWIGGGTKAGYGLIGYGRKRRFYTHRLAYELIHGPLVKGDQVLHHCDNPPCCNPKHLFKGTHTDNMRDCAEKGRAYTPTRLTNEQVRRIGTLYIDGHHPDDIAGRFGITKRTVFKYIYGERRAHLFTEAELQQMQCIATSRRGTGRWSNYAVKPQ